MKKFAAFIIIVVIIFGWYVSLFGMTAGGLKIKPIQDNLRLGLDLKGGVYVVLEAKTDASGAELKRIMEQTQQVIERRVNEIGLSEPIVTIEGENKLRVELPGADNVEQAVELIGKTAQLAFVMPDGTPVLTGEQVKDASITTDSQKGGYAVSLEFNSAGADAFLQATTELAKQSPAQTVQSEAFGEMPANVLVIVLDNQIISYPGVSEPIQGGKAVITGNFTDDEAGELAALIRGGSLPVPLEEVQSSLIGPTLGMDAFRGSVIAGAIGIGLIFVFMFAMYKLMGLTANIALLLYVLIVLWVMMALGAVLTLPGIAGIILSVGMAVDSNVIIFSRIQEEIQVHGKTLRVAVGSGFHRAFSTIIDTHITTIITGLLLYQLGSGPVKGFAATLLIGIITSLFTAVVVTQLFLVLFAESKPLSRNEKIFGVKMLHLPTMAIVKNRKRFYIISVALIVVGLGVGMVRGFNFGMDFTGGSMIQINMEKEVTVDEIKAITQSNGIKADVLHAGEGNKEIIIKTQQALQSEERDDLYEDIFAKYSLDKSNILQTEVFGPSIGDILRQNAIRATLLAAAGILIYIAVRFEWRFGVAAVVALFHDVLLMIAFYGLFNIPINTPFIASMLIIFGYSVSDTVVIFDRIRENTRVNAKMKPEELIDASVNQTVVRSLATSFTTLLAILALFIMGASSIKEFTMPLLVGIIAGAASSIFIASPLWYELVRLTKRSKYKGKEAK